MIGINVRGLRHLYRLSDSSLKPVLINFREYGHCFCHVTIIKRPSSQDRLVIFNSHYNHGDTSFGDYMRSGLFNSEVQRFLMDRYNRVLEFRTDRLVQNDFPYFYDITLLPDDFEEQYNKFLSSNAKLIRNLSNKYDLNGGRGTTCKRIFMYTDGSKNFFQWAISSYFQNGTSMATIRRIMMWNESYGQLAKNLQKNTITAYTSLSDMMGLMEELRLLRRDKRVNDSINLFNTAQKRILKNAELSEKDKDTIAKFYRLSETKKVNFVRKMSTIEDFDEIMRQIRHITSTHFEWNKNSFMDFITNVEGMKFETIYDQGDIVLVKVGDYETVKNLAKTTNWCISKNKTYWNQYVEQRADSTQYMVFDFSKKEDDLLSIIGFTTEYNKGITHAHDFSNNDMMASNVNTDRMFLKSFIENFNSGQGIYNVLKNCGIDITLVAQYDKPLYKWDKETMYNYLYECVNKAKVDVLHDEGNLVALSVRDSNVRYFLGDAYIDNVSSDTYDWQHLIFLDFSMSEYDPNRIQFAIIRSMPGEQEDYCSGIYNEHAQGINTPFDAKLSQYGLPYDIIRRPNDIYVKIKNAFVSYNIPLLRKLLKETSADKLREVIYDYIGEAHATDIITSSITDSMSFDFLDLFYDNNIPLNSIFDSGYVNSILKQIISQLIAHGRMGEMNGDYKLPTEEDLKEFYSNNCRTIDKALYVGMYLAIKKIIKNEGKGHNPNTMYRRLVGQILMSRKGNCEIFEDIMFEIGGLLNFNENHETISNWISFAFLHGSDRIKEFAKDVTSKYKYPKMVWDNLEARFNKTKQDDNVTTYTATYQAPDELNIAPPDMDFLDDDDEMFDEDGEVYGDEHYEEEYNEAEAEEPAEAF